MREMALPVYLPRPTYERLVQLAHAEDRDPTQQASWLLKRALEAPSGLISDRTPAEVAGA
jgi:hypothetical protein